MLHYTACISQDFENETTYHGNAEIIGAVVDPKTKLKGEDEGEESCKEGCSAKIGYVFDVSIAPRTDIQVTARGPGTLGSDESGAIEEKSDLVRHGGLCAQVRSLYDRS